MAMAASLEIRLPFLDHDIIELSTHIPPNLKLHHGIEKFILRNAVKNIVPKQILKRKKNRV
ncbi:MAG: asparagine synthase-related protein [Promethearchaeota archaeon]